jgi:serine/threonine-protein kinase
VLYEMLCGRRLFEGETATEILSSVLRQEIRFDSLPAATPLPVRRLLARCLERDPRRRLRDIGDARLELESPALDEGDTPLAPPNGRSRHLPWLAALAAGALLGGAATWFATRDAEEPRSGVTRFALHGIRMPIDSFQGIALSPDGRRLVYRSRGPEGRELLQVRSFDSFEATALRGTELGWFPFFSPDGERLAFYSPRGLETMPIENGVAHPIATLGEGFAGGTWLPDDTIVFAVTADRRLRRVVATGGQAEYLEVEGLDADDIVIAPSALPEAGALLCGVGSGSGFDIAVYDLASRTVRRIAENGFNPTWAASGHVLYQQGTDGPLMALPFDARKRAATGPPFPVVSDLGSRASYQIKMFAVAGDGTLAYVPQSSVLDRGALVWVDPEGKVTPIVELSKVLDTPRLSPDGSRVAFRTPAPNCDIWVHDLERGVTTRITHEGDSHGNAWSPHGDRIVVARRESLDWSIASLAADGAGALERLSDPIPNAITATFSPDGELVLVQSRRESTGADVEAVSLRERTVVPVLATRFHERAPALSPDGRLLAYVSDESGRHEVYVQTFPALDVRRQISIDGGVEPVWSRSGNELYFRSGRQMLAAAVASEPQLRAGRPRVLFEGDYVSSGGFALPSYDVAADGRFVMIRESSGAGGAEIHVVQGWFEELRGLEATGDD